MYRYAFLLSYSLLISGCSQPSEIGGEVTAASFNTAGAPTVEFSVPDMMCPDSCVMATKEILSAQPGVKEVLVNFDAKTATVAVDQDAFQTEAALAALADRGFVHSEVKQRQSAGTDSNSSAPETTQPAG
jgi:copper chaperone CopZ